MNRLFEELAVCGISEGENGAEQMAIDEALLRHCTAPTLRVYEWRNREVTFGYPMHWEEVAEFARGRPATRRCTGGGLVEHGEDITVCLAVPRADPLSEFPPVEVYRRIHLALLSAIKLSTATLAAQGTTSSACFAAPSRYDIVAGDRKLAGGALRRGRDGLLYQGSLQTEAAVSDIARALGRRIVPWIEPEGWASGVEALRRSRYANPAWNRKR